MRLKSAFTVVCVLLLAQAACAQEIKDHTLTVRGKVQVYAKADRATIRFDIKGVGNTLKAAFDQARATMDTISQQLYAIGLTSQNLSTSFFRSEENYDDKAFLSSKRDYRVLMTVTVSTENMSLLEQIAVIVNGSKIERMSNFAFELTKEAEIRRDALRKATLDASANAHELASLLGFECSDVLVFEELVAPEPKPAVDDLLSRISGVEARGGFGFGMASPKMPSFRSNIFPEELRFDCEVRVVYAVKQAAEKTP